MTWRERLRYFFLRYFGWELRHQAELELEVEEGSCCEDRSNHRLDPTSGELDCVSCGETLATPPGSTPNPFEDVPMSSPTDLSPQDVKDEIERLGYQFFSGQHNPNLFGIRILEDADEWNDWIGCLYEDEFGELQMDLYQGSTDPGIPWLIKPMKEEGCAVLAAGQHRGCWVFGFHRGKYRALIQHGARVKIHRDNDRSKTIDVSERDEIFSGFYGINLHRASAHRLVDNVGLYSGGCMVIRDAGEFEALLDFLDSTQEVWGDRFSFTLLNWPFGEDNGPA